MTTINVGTTSALNSALKAAKAGDTILLSSGTYTINVSKLAMAGMVTIASADADRPAVVTSLSVNDSSGFTFRDLDLSAGTGAGNNPFTVAASQNIHFSGLSVHGSLDGKPQNDVNGFLIRESKNISITDSEFQDLGYGISHLNSDTVTIADSEFHHLQFDGVRGGGSSNVTITRNFFHDFFPSSGDHPDAIQFWTTNTTTIARNLVITDNAFLRGAGAPTQGIFFRDQVGNLPYEKVVITGNVMAGATYNGIMVNHARDVTVTDNLVQGFTDRKSWIRLEDVSGANVTGNDANDIIFMTTKSLINLDNLKIALATDNGAWAISQWTGRGGVSAQQVRLEGDADANVLLGTGGADSMFGRQGDDTITGGAGDDVLRGGAHSDRFVFRAGDGDDTIVDFTAGDAIDASALLKAGHLAVVLPTPSGVSISFTSGDSILLPGTSAEHVLPTTTGWVFG